METILNFVSNTSGLSFIVISFFLFMGVFVNQISRKGDFKYLIVVFIVGGLVSFKVMTTEVVTTRYHLHIMEMMALMLSFSMIVFMKKVAITKRYLSLVTWAVIVFQLLNINKFSVLEMILPQYRLLLVFYGAFIGFFGIWLLYKKMFRKRALFIILIALYCAGASFAKWLAPLLPIYAGAVAYYFWKTRSIAFNFITIVPVTILLFLALVVASDSLARMNGFKNFQDYYSVRVTKDAQQEKHSGKDLYNQIGGVGDGARLFVWGIHVNAWLDGNVITGVPLSFTNPFEMPEHNVFVCYITRLGVFSVLYFILAWVYFKNKSLDYKRLRVPYIGLLTFVFILFFVGGLYGVPLACLGISSMIGLYQNNFNAVSLIS